MLTLTPGSWSELSCEESSEPRLDSFLARACEGLSRTAAQRLISEAQVKVNGAAVRANHKLQLGDLISVFLPKPVPLSLAPEAIPLKIVYEDASVAVIEKPAGMVVHPSFGHSGGTLVNALLHHMEDLSSGSGIGGELRPGIVHRIDRNTSGILLVTKTDSAHQKLSLQFKEHSITRRYLGLCWGKLPPSGEWNAPIGRDPKERKRMAVVPTGRAALTRYRALSHFGETLTAFEAELFTGRTHQVRVHFAANGFALAGDTIYFSAQRSARNKRDAGFKAVQRRCPEAAVLIAALEAGERQFLHAAALGFSHPETGKRLEFTSPLPPELEAIMLSLAKCSW